MVFLFFRRYTNEKSTNSNNFIIDRRLCNISINRLDNELKYSYSSINNNVLFNLIQNFKKGDRGMMIFIILLIVLIVFLVILYEFLSYNHQNLKKKYKELKKNAERLQREFNTLNLWYTSQKEALEFAENKNSNAKH